MGLRVVAAPFKVHGNGEFDHKGAATSRFVQILQHVAHLGVFQSRSVVTGPPPSNRLAQPLHGELDILRLQMAPALDFGLVSILWEALEVFRGQLFGGRPLPGEFFADERVWWHGGIKAHPATAGNRPAPL